MRSLILVAFNGFLQVDAKLIQVKTGELHEFRLDARPSLVVFEFLSIFNLLHLKLNELFIV